MRSLLKSLETKDPKPLGYIDPGKFIQHDPRIEDGLEGFDDTPTSFHDFSRIVGGKMVEHWNVLETLVAREPPKNSNVKF